MSTIEVAQAAPDSEIVVSTPVDIVQSSIDTTAAITIEVQQAAERRFWSAVNMAQTMVSKFFSLEKSDLPRISALDLRPDREIYVSRSTLIGASNPGQLAISGLEGRYESKELVPPHL